MKVVIYKKQADVKDEQLKIKPLNNDTVEKLNYFACLNSTDVDFCIEERKEGKLG